MSFKLSSNITWLSWLSQCIVFQIRKGNVLTDQKFMLSFVWLFSFLTNQNIILSLNLGLGIFEDS